MELALAFLVIMFLYGLSEANELQAARENNRRRAHHPKPYPRGADVTWTERKARWAEIERGRSQSSASRDGGGA